MNSRTKIHAATEAARKKLEGGYKPFNTKKTGCTANGCGVPAKPGAASNTEKHGDGAK